jgi:hypothetical protein
VNVGKLDLQLSVQLVPITTKVVNSHPAHDEVYLMQHYVIKFVSDLWRVGTLNLESVCYDNVPHPITEDDNEHQ